MATVVHVLVTTCCTIVLLADSPAFCAESPRTSLPTRVQPVEKQPEWADKSTIVRTPVTVASLYAAVIRTENNIWHSDLVACARRALSPDAVVNAFPSTYRGAPSAEARRALVYFLCTYAKECTDIPAATRLNALTATMNALDNGTPRTTRAMSAILYTCSEIDAKESLPAAQQFCITQLCNQRVTHLEMNKHLRRVCREVQYVLLSARTREGNLSAAAVAGWLADGATSEDNGSYSADATDLLRQVLFPMAIVMGELPAIEAAQCGILTRDGCRTFITRFETLAATDRLSESARQNLASISTLRFRLKGQRMQWILLESWEIASAPEKRLTDYYVTNHGCYLTGTMQTPPWLVTSGK